MNDSSSRSAIDSVGFPTAPSVHDSEAGNISHMGLTKRLMACHCQCRVLDLRSATALPKAITPMAQWGYVPVTTSAVLGMSYAVAYKLRATCYAAQTAFGACLYIRSYTRGCYVTLSSTLPGVELFIMSSSLLLP